MQPIDNNEAFDALIRQVLDNVEVDASLADKYWPGGQLPPQEIKVPGSKWTVWFSISLLFLIITFSWRQPSHQNRSVENVVATKKAVDTENKPVAEVSRSVPVRPVKETMLIDSSGTKSLAFHTKQLTAKNQKSKNDTNHSADLQSGVSTKKKQLFPLSATYDSLTYAATPPQLKVAATLPAIENKQTDTASKKAPYIIW